MRDEPVDALDVVRDATLQPLLLFPSDDHEVLNARHFEAARKQNKRIMLIVPDGNWRQGAKTVNRTPGLECVPRVRLPAGLASEYALRTEPHSTHVSTFEAIARALRIGEGEDVFEQLMSFFRLKVDRTLWSRGILPADQVRGGVPEAAIEAFRIAGIRGGPRSRDDAAGKHQT